jgi:hypothetical protein
MPFFCRITPDFPLKNYSKALTRKPLKRPTKKEHFPAFIFVLSIDTLHSLFYSN